MPDEQRRYRRAAFAAFACAGLNAGAAVGMVLFLRPGLLASPGRLEFIRASTLAWRASWGLWILSAISLALFFLSLQRATGGPRIAAWIAIAGLLPDLGAETIYIACYPSLAAADLARYDRLCAVLSATLGNGAYTAAWHLLARRSGLPRGTLLLSVPGIAAGYLLALAGIVYSEAGPGDLDLRGDPGVRAVGARRGPFLLEEGRRPGYHVAPCMTLGPRPSW